MLNQARSLDTFGVAGLLDPKCRVFYCNLFSPNHVGQVSDLLAAQLRSGGQGELRLRALLLFSVFQAYSNRVGSPVAVGSGQAGMLSTPVTLECGVDATQVAVGISIGLPTTAEPPDAEALPRRVRTGEADGELERFVASLFSFSDEIVVRVHRASRRIEVVALLASTDDAAPAGEREIKVVYLPDGPLVEAPKAEAYMELGDLDYPRLLKPDAPSRQERDRALAPDEIRIGADEPESKEGAVTRVKGGKSASGSDDDIQHIKGGESSDGGEDEETRISGGAEGGGLGELIRKIWPFSKRKEQDDEEIKIEGDSAELEASGDVSIPADGEEPAAEPDTVVAAPAADGASQNAEATARRLMVELQAGNLDRTIDKARREMNDIKGELKSKRAQRWADGLMAELLSEKSRLHEMARKLNTAVRQKEVEFRNKETGLKEEIRRRDDTLRQKEFAIARGKDQVQQMRMAMDRMKATQVGAGDDVHYRQKYNLTQKLYTGAKEENTKLSAQLDQLKTEVQNLRYTAKKGEEYKKQYLALADKAADKSPTGAAATAAKRAETEAKMAAVYKKEASDLRSRVNELQLKTEEADREDARLKKEVARLQAELKTAKASGSGSSSAA